MATHEHTCEGCGVAVEAEGLRAFGDAYISHIRAQHPDWPFPDMAIRNFAEATQRLTGSTIRLEAIGRVTIHPVTEARIGDWLTFFDHEAFAGNPVDAVCYCSGPHLFEPQQQGGAEMRPWRQNREFMVGLLRSGRSFGYLAYVDDHAAGWVNASTRSECSMYRLGRGADTPDEDVISVSCFLISPPYRRHGLSNALLQRVLDDAPGRQAAYVEAYPLNERSEFDAGNNRGHRSLFEDHGFELIERRERDSVMRHRVGAG